MNDECDRSAEREEMVRSQLAARRIRDERVLDAMRTLPRELFVPESLWDRAYADAALPVDCNQTISQPYMVARMTELLELRADDRVLEVGTGTGYQTAILAALAAEVFTIEWHLPLMTSAAERLRRLGYENVSYRCSDGSSGWAEGGPFDAIMVTAGAPDVPPSLERQLTIGGRLVVPVGDRSSQTLVRVMRTESRFDREEYLKCRFVKLVGREGWRD